MNWQVYRATAIAISIVSYWSVRSSTLAIRFKVNFSRVTMYLKLQW